MIDPTVSVFVKSQLALGTTKEQITNMLMTQGGWTKQDVDDIFAQMAPKAAAPMPPTPGPTQAPAPVVPAAVSQDFTPPTSFMPVQPQPAPTSIQPVPKISVSPMAGNPQFQQKKKNRIGLFLLIVIILLILGAGSAYAYYYFIPSSVSRPDPKTEITQALANTLTVDALSYSATATINGITTGTSSPSQIFLSATTTGASDFTQSEPALDARFQATANIESTNGGVAYSVNGNVNLEIRVLNQTAYFILNTLSLNSGNSQTAVLAGIASGIASGIEGKWIEATSTPYSTTSIPNTATISNERQALITKLETLDFINSINQLSDAVVNGVSTYHYSVIIDPDKLLTDIASVASSSVPVATQYQSSPLTIELFIGKKDTLIYEFLIPQQSAATAASQGTMAGSLIMDNFNQPAGIVAPPNAISLQSLLSGFFGSPASVSQTKTQTTKPK